MTTRQEMFAELVASGMTQREAYRKVYPNSRKWKDSSVDSQASILAKTQKVSQRLRAARKEAAETARLSRDAKLEMIEEDLARAVKDHDRYGMIALIKLHNEMTGDNAPEKKVVTLDLLSTIAARHRDVLEDE